jgi:tetratricopeptide (TPR) repeat protein
MTPEQFQRLEALYDAAAAIDPARRAQFIDESCAGDEELRRELLAAFRSESSGFTGVVAHAAAGAAEGDNSWTGRRVGPYRIVRPLGRGGMGAVHLAVRDDDQFHKEVAIKTLKFDLDGGPAVLRFRHERQILAHLEHPNIARLLDGGATEHGSPYIVLEYIEGMPITQWCEERHLTVEQRLQLFRLVCEAVHYSHQHLIVHRDLKPANILVTSAGVPKLLDFGIAKLLASDAPLASVTATGAVLMTPDYVSPEQVRGEAVSTATDVYALGAVLYEMLTGHRAHDLQRYDPIEIARVVCETDIRPPSTWGDRRLRGDLDTIVLKAMQKNPTRRYASVVEFSEDVRRHLDGLPVAARPDTTLYRATKFARRHWIGIAATAAVVISLAVGVAISLQQAGIAQRRFAQVRELANTFLFQFYDQVAPLPGSTAVRASIVGTARNYLDSLAKEAGNDQELLFELAEAYQRLGNVQGRTGAANLGQLDDARRSYQNAFDLYGRLPSAARATPDVRRRVAKVLWDQGRLEYNASREDEAERFTNRALETLGDGPEPATRLLRAQAQRGLGDIRVRQGKPREALALLESALRTLLELEATGSEEQGLTEGLQEVRLRLARALIAVGDLDAGLNAYEELLRALAPCEAQNPASSSCRDRAVRLGWMADVYAALDRPNLNEPAKAVPLYQQAVGISERLVALDEKDRQARFDLAARYGKLGDAVLASDPARAIELYDRALKTAQSLASKEQLQAIYEAYTVAISRPLIQLGRLGEARKVLVQVLPEAKAETARGYGDVLGEIDLRLIWVRLLIAEHRDDEAQATLREMIRDLAKICAEHPEDLSPVFSLSASYRALAAISTGPERREALLNSARAWQSWPATTFTTREQQRDLAAADNASR